MTTRDLVDGESAEWRGSGSSIYTLKNVGGAYSCSCPAWRNQNSPPERRSCKHLRALRGDAAEAQRVGAAAPPASSDSTVGDTRATESAAPPLLLAHSWEGTDPAGHWVSEKLDGVRAYWDGECLLSRLGNKFHAPPWFTQVLPSDMTLDGELFAGRKLFQKAVSIVRRQDQSDAWREITFVIFDAPSVDAPFEARIERAKELVTRSSASHVRMLDHELCRDLEHLKAELARVEALGGEGLMLRRAGSRYEAGRSSTLLKVKNFHDTEARVVGHIAGAGRHKGRLGALACQLPDGTKFSVGTGFSDQERESPPPVGAIITFRYQELSADGVPRFPSYVGVRDDVVLAAPPAKPAARKKGTSGEVDRVAAAKAARAAQLRRTFKKGDDVVQVALRGAECITRFVEEERIETETFGTATEAWRRADEVIDKLRHEGFEEV